MSEKKDKKQDVTASQENVGSLAGIAALASAIFSVSEPEEIADVPGWTLKTSLRRMIF